MMTTNRRNVSVACAIIFAAAVGSSAADGPRHAVPRASRPAPRASAPSHGGVSPARVRPPGEQHPALQRANGVARYGYGHGGAPWIGRPCWDWWFPWWGFGSYADFAYGAWYGPSVVPYVVASASPPRGPAIVETDVSPSKAEVVLDGEPVGFAADYDGRWDQLQLTPGKHTIAFRAEGYRTLVIEFEARPGARYDFDDLLAQGDGEDHRTLSAPPSDTAPGNRGGDPTSTPTGGRLKLRVQPADAAVYLDGEYLASGTELERIHRAIPVVAGTHRVEAVRPGYVSQFRIVEVGETDVAAVDLTLEHER